MKIVLCIKQVPDTSDIKWTENNTIQREGLESILNPYDVYSLDSVVKFKKDNPDVEISAVTMGPNQAEKVLRKAVSVGADRGILLSDKKFSGADTYATGKTIAAAIKSKLSDYDLIVCGQFAVDGDTAQTGPSIANFLGIPQITYVSKILEYDGDCITVLREFDEGLETVKVKLPALICMLKGDYETVRADINGVKKAQTAEILTYTLDDIGLSAEEVGLKGSPTYVSKAFRASGREVVCEFVDDVDKLGSLIREGGFLHE
ncbi:MAG: electron transfer flavoprotein subunit beta/FixA family protein [Candidatus Gastranaerophilaceae bacterium]|nr:electron transfer flavoprotein subunit beta/FixA family protein [Candidatus Gastranaerophilaceae bacterium]